MNENFNLKELKGSKLGYYLGSFDPLHLGHQHVIEKALSSGLDYILIYPVPGGDTYKNRVSLDLRLQMVASVYKDHPRVLFTSWTPKELQERLSSLDLEIVGVIGSDVVTDTLMSTDPLTEKKRRIFMRGIPLEERHYTDTIGALMALRADSFLVALRGDVDLSHLNGYVHDRPICGFIPSTTISSTEAKKAIQSREPFHHYFSPSVYQIILEEKLYGLHDAKH